MAFLLPIAFSTSVAAQVWSPRVALLLVLAAFGLPRLFGVLRSDARPPALAGLVFLSIAALATALSPQPVLSVIGLYDWGAGLLFVAVLVGAWALGTSLDAEAVPSVELALIAGVLVNAVVGVVQGAFSLDAAPFTRYEGRAAGLLGNPVHFGTLMIAGLALVLPRVRNKPLRWGAATVLVAAAVQLSGSRFALALAILLALVTLVRERRRAVLGAATIVLGLVLGVGIGAAGGTTTGAGRVEPGGGTVTPTARLHTWRNAGHAIADRPLLGSGPGRYRAATSPYRDLALVHAEGPDRLFVDAHNVFVEYATTTGILGVLAFAAWLFLACRRGRGPLLAFALLVLAMHLFEPQFVGTTPLAFLALGAAGRAEMARLGRRVSALTAVLALTAVVAGGRLLYGDFQLHQATLDLREGPAKAAVAALPPWSEPSEVAGRAALYRSITTRAPDARTETLRWDRLATRRDDTNPAAWSTLAEAQLYFGDARSAVPTFKEALRWNPWSVRALNGLANAYLADGDRAKAKAALERSLTAEPDQKKARVQLRGL